MSKGKKSVQIVYATATTPAESMVGETEKQRLHLSPAEFRVQLKATADDVKSLVKIARKVGGLKSGQTIEVEGQVFGAKQLNALVTQHIKTMKQLSKNYSARATKKKTASTKPRKAGEGFSKGSFLQDPLINFLRAANFGASNDAVHAAIDPLLDQNVLSRAILTPLLTLYLVSNGLRFEEVGDDGKTKVYYKTNAQMNKVLGPYLSAEESSDTGFGKSGNARMKFNRNKFVYNRIQSFLNPGILDKESLDAEQVAYLENAAVKQAIADAQTVVSQANAQTSA